ncbi:hypothetical protein ABK040_006719 [Willaertia magna]
MFNRALSVGKHGRPKNIKIKLNPNHIEEILIQPKDELTEILTLIATKYQTIAPNPDKYVLFVMGHPENLVPWTTLTKNLIKEQCELEIKPEWYPSKNTPNNVTLDQLQKTGKLDISDKVFGGKLPEHYYIEENVNQKRFRNIPPILRKLYDYILKDRSLRYIGIFRLVANASHVQQLIETFNELQRTNKKFDEIVFENTLDPNIVVALLKEYFKQLDVPLLHPKERFMEIGRIEKVEKRIEEFTDALNKLNHVIYKKVFKELIEVLAEFIYHHNLNKTNPKLLSLALGPFILQQEKEQMIGSTFPNGQIYINLIGMCLEHYEKIFTEETQSNGNGGSTAGGGGKLGQLLDRLRIQQQQQLQQQNTDSNTNSNNNNEDISSVQDRWREYVESWKEKYKQEKEIRDQVKHELDEKSKEWSKERKELEEEMAKLKLAISSSEISEDDQLIGLEDERKQLMRDIERERERYKLEKESHESRMRKIKRRQLLILKKLGIELGDESNAKLTPEYFKLIRKQQEGGEINNDIKIDDQEEQIYGAAVTTAMASSSSNVEDKKARTTVGGNKIQVDSRFKKKK